MQDNDYRRIREKVLDRLIDSMPFTVLVDATGHIIKITRSYAEYLGVDPDESVGRYITDVIPTSGIPRALESRKDIIGELFVLKNGETIVVSRYAIMDGDELIGAISTTILDSLQYVDLLKEQLAEMDRRAELYRREANELHILQRLQDNIAGESEVMLRLKRDLARIADTDAGVLITGETGTGKELVANAIQYMSPRHNQPYVKINCAAIPSELMESELFGYEPGAFSGANRKGKPGKFELADHGTILLDEIGEMPLALQAKLLRVIQEQEVERVGGTKPKKINVRILCSTNRNLHSLIAEGRFRMDLYFRINVVEINVPPLRYRKEDIELLADRLIRENNIHDGLMISGISREAVQLLMEYDWPGNVRELKHVLERAGVQARSGRIEAAHLDFFIPLLDHIGTEEDPVPVRTRQAEVAAPAGSIPVRRSQLEKHSIIEALSYCGGNKKKAAAFLGISRSTLYEKMKQYGI